MGGADRRLQDLGIQLPAAPTPFGTYVETAQTGNLLFLSGMLPVVDHKPKFVGRLGKELDLFHQRCGQSGVEQGFRPCIEAMKLQAFRL